MPTEPALAADLLNPAGPVSRSHRHYPLGKLPSSVAWLLTGLLALARAGAAPVRWQVEHWWRIELRAKEVTASLVGVGNSNHPGTEHAKGALHSSFAAMLVGPAHRQQRPLTLIELQTLRRNAWQSERIEIYTRNRQCKLVSLKQCLVNRFKILEHYAASLRRVSLEVVLAKE